MDTVVPSLSKRIIWWVGTTLIAGFILSVFLSAAFWSTEPLFYFALIMPIAALLNWRGLAPYPSRNEWSLFTKGNIAAFIASFSYSLVLVFVKEGAQSSGDFYYTVSIFLPICLLLSSGVFMVVNIFRDRIL